MTLSLQKMYFTTKEIVMKQRTITIPNRSTYSLAGVGVCGLLLYWHICAYVIPYTVGLSSLTLSDGSINFPYDRAVFVFLVLWFLATTNVCLLVNVFKPLGHPSKELGLISHLVIGLISGILSGIIAGVIMVLSAKIITIVFSLEKCIPSDFLLTVFVVAGIFIGFFDRVIRGIMAECKTTMLGGVD